MSPRVVLQDSEFPVDCRGDICDKIRGSRIKRATAVAGPVPTTFHTATGVGRVSIISQATDRDRSAKFEKPDGFHIYKLAWGARGSAG